MAAFIKFNAFAEYLLIARAIDFDADTFKVLLTNGAPVATNSLKGDLTEISSGNGYTAGGPSTAVVFNRSGATSKITPTDVVITAAGGSIGPFRYAVLYDDTPVTPAKPLIGAWDYGASITVADGETFTVDFDGTNGALQVA